MALRLARLAFASLIIVPLALLNRSPGQLSSARASSATGIASARHAALSNAAVSRVTAAALPALTVPGGADWAASAKDVPGDAGTQSLFVCPAKGTLDQPVWGTDTYTDDSAVCVAAVHTGAITVDDGGFVTIEIRPGLDSYAGSTRNGVTSEDFGSWDRSFAIVTAIRGSGEDGVAVGGGSWDATATDFADSTGSRYLYLCPPGGHARRVWGTYTYTSDSSVCTAAVHIGLITAAAGGYVTVLLGGGADSFEGSARNGVTTSDYGSWGATFTFPSAPLPATATASAAQTVPSTSPSATPTATATPAPVLAPQIRVSYHYLAGYRAIVAGTVLPVRVMATPGSTVTVRISLRLDEPNSSAVVFKRQNSVKIGDMGVATAAVYIDTRPTRWEFAVLTVSAIAADGSSDTQHLQVVIFP